MIESTFFECHACLYGSPQGVTSFYSSADVISHLRTAAQSYYTLPQTSVSHWDVSSSFSVSIHSTSGLLHLTSTAADPVGFLNDTIFSTLQEIFAIVPEYKFKNYLRLSGEEDTDEPFMSATILWDVQAYYSFGNGAGRVSYDTYFTNTIKSTSKPTLTIIASIIIVLCALSLGLTIKALMRCFAAFQFAKENLQGSPNLPWETLSFSDKLAFFNIWFRSFSLFMCLMGAGIACLAWEVTALL